MITQEFLLTNGKKGRINHERTPTLMQKVNADYDLVPKYLWYRTDEPTEQSRNNKGCVVPSACHLRRPNAEHCHTDQAPEYA